LAQGKKPGYTGQHITEKHGITFIPQAGFEPMIPTFERSKIKHALDRAATGAGFIICVMRLLSVIVKHVNYIVS